MARAPESAARPIPLGTIAWRYDPLVFGPLLAAIAEAAGVERVKSEVLPGVWPTAAVGIFRTMETSMTSPTV